MKAKMKTNNDNQSEGETTALLVDELLESNKMLHLKVANLTLACKQKDAALQQAGYAMTLSKPSLRSAINRLVYVAAKSAVDVALAIKPLEDTTP
jgi:hypothetical protein